MKSSASEPGLSLLGQGRPVSKHLHLYGCLAWLNLVMNLLHLRLTVFICIVNSMICSDIWHK